jgi:3'(2'), 5'-bisphosphate nucleotidase
VQAELETAKKLALSAGGILLKYYSQPAVSWKGLGDPVTEADRSANAFIVDELKRAFPQDGILSEEERDDAVRLSKSRVWIIDPLDGTVEFIEHRDDFSVMIGLSIEGVASLGVVYQPLPEKLYYAASGMGAFLTEGTTTRPLNVSAETNPFEMTIALSRSHHSPDVNAIQRLLGIHKTINAGSLGVKVGLICEARAHLYLHAGRHTSQWDACAPDAILREAGGRMSDVFNEPLRYNGPDVKNLRGVLASNGTIHDRIAQAAQSVVGGKF